MVYLEVVLFAAMVQILLERSASRVWYLWDKKDTHGKQTLALTNITSQHDQVEIKESIEMDFAIFIENGD